MSARRHGQLAALASHLAGRDVRAIVRGALDGQTFWVLFGPRDSGFGYAVSNYVWRRGHWQPDGDNIDAGSDEQAGWDMLGALFVRAFTQPE